MGTKFSHSLPHFILIRLRGWIRINTRDFGAELTSGVTNPSAMRLAAFLRGSRTAILSYQKFNEVREIYVTFEAPTGLSTRPSRLFKGLNDADQTITEWYSCFPDGLPYGTLTQLGVVQVVITGVGDPNVPSGLGQTAAVISSVYAPRIVYFSSIEQLR